MNSELFFSRNIKAMLEDDGIRVDSQRRLSFVQKKGSDTPSLQDYVKSLESWKDGGAFTKDDPPKEGMLDALGMKKSFHRHIEGLKERVVCGVISSIGYGEEGEILEVTWKAENKCQLRILQWDELFFSDHYVRYMIKATRKLLLRILPKEFCELLEKHTFTEAKNILYESPVELKEKHIKRLLSKRIQMRHGYWVKFGENGCYLGKVNQSRDSILRLYEKDKKGNWVTASELVGYSRTYTKRLLEIVEILSPQEFDEQYVKIQ